uniref:Uncharacterized protein n=1 Tax=Echeneis naucrates TaxID=173247 RepID=A0A665XE48_ECHNA
GGRLVVDYVVQGLNLSVGLLLVKLLLHRHTLTCSGKLQAMFSVRSWCGSTSSPFLQRFSSFSSQVMVFLRVLFFSFSLSYFCFHCSAVSSILTVTVFLIVFALKAEKKKKHYFILLKRTLTRK